MGPLTDKATSLAAPREIRLHQRHPGQTFHEPNPTHLNSEPIPADRFEPGCI